MSDPNCVFCKIVAGVIPSTKVYEDDLVMAFADINPKARVHLLIIPKKHVASLSETDADDELLLGKLMHTAAKVGKQQGLAGYKLLMNVNKEGGQVVFHVHLHLLGGGPIDLEHC